MRVRVVRRFAGDLRTAVFAAVLRAAVFTVRFFAVAPAAFFFAVGRAAFLRAGVFLTFNAVLAVDFRFTVDLRAVVFLAVAFFAVVFFVVDLRVVVFLAALRVVAFRVVVLRAVDLRVVALRPVVLRAVVLALVAVLRFAFGLAAFAFFVISRRFPDSLTLCQRNRGYANYGKKILKNSTLCQNYFTSSSSTSKIRASFGPIGPPGVPDSL